MLQMTRPSRLCTFLLLRFEVFEVRLQKKSDFSRFYRDTQRRDFGLLEDNSILLYELHKTVYCRTRGFRARRTQ
jgi:hypothetical protein